MLARALLDRSLSKIAVSSQFKRCWSSITPTETGVKIHALNNTTFPYIWLRDSCQSPTCIHPSTRQKLHRSSDIPRDIRPASFTQDDIRLNDRGLEIRWNDGHQSIFPRSFLEIYGDRNKLRSFHKDITQVIWDRTSIQKPELFIPYDQVRTPGGLVKAITQLVRYGLVFVQGVPNEKSSNEECELTKLAETFGQIRPTFYGSMWDVVDLKNSKNIAYTNLYLGLHMDLLYFQHPPRYQILHCLRNRVRGGSSVFVDAVGAAEILREKRPDCFDVLTKTPVAFHYINDSHHLHYEHRTIELAHPNSFEDKSKRRIEHVNYSPPFQAPLPLDTPPEFYSAFSEFTKLLNDPKLTYEYTLREGDAVLFDNRRVLHARTAFYEREDTGLKDGEPHRRLKGCYLEAEGIMDRLRFQRMMHEGAGI